VEVEVEVGETYLLAEALDELSRVLAREAGAGGGDEQRPVCASGDGLVHGVRDGGVQGCDGGLGGLTVALDVQHTVASLLAEVLDVGAHGL
jgi:hypothetical protein